MRRFLPQLCTSLATPSSKLLPYRKYSAAPALSKATTSQDVQELLQEILRKQRLNIKSSTSGYRQYLSDIGLSDRDLPVDVPGADDIWKAILTNSDLHQRIFDYAVDLRSRTTKVYGMLYYHIMANILGNPRHAKEEAVEMHRAFKLHYIIPPRAVELLATVAIKTNKGTGTFKTLYIQCQPMRLAIYDRIVHPLVLRGELITALEWHQLLLANGDAPQIHDTISEIQYKRPDLIPLINQYHHEPNTFIARSQNSREIESQADLSYITGLSLPASSSTSYALSDAICARLFATSTFSLRFIISGFHLFETKEIGPLSTRELFLRARSADEAVTSLEILRGASINIQPSSYTDIVLYLVNTKQFDLLQSVVHSDLHPEAFEDVPLQHRLLEMYRASSDEVAVRRTKAIIEFLSNPTPNSSTFILRTFEFQSSELYALGQYLEDWFAQSDIDHQEINAVLTEMLDYHNYRLGTVSVLSTTTAILNIAHLALKQGHFVSPQILFRSLKRLGRTGRFDLVWRFSTHLVASINRPGVPSKDGVEIDFELRQSSNPNLSMSKHLPASHPQNYLGQIFQPQLLGLILTWGTSPGESYATQGKRVNGTSTYHVGPSTFFLGLRLIDHLRQYGLPIQYNLLDMYICRHLFNLCSRSLTGNSSLRDNVNTWTLEELIVGVIGMWRGQKILSSLYQLEEGSQPLTWKGNEVPQVLRGLLPLGYSPRGRHERRDNAKKIRQTLFGTFRTDLRGRYTAEQFDEWIDRDAEFSSERIMRKFGGSWTLDKKELTANVTET